jgi:WD repeat-containing protein 23
MKLWDLRMVMSPRDFRGIDRGYRQSDFDYRWATYDEDDWYRHPNDNSVVTFRGHRILRTLIRCHFSPPGSTNSRYVYSGSEDGKVYIWNMDATLAGKVDVLGGTRNSRPPYGHNMMDARWSTCVRDASWHPSAPMIVGTYLCCSWTAMCSANYLQHLLGTVMVWRMELAAYIHGMMVQRKMKPSQKWA